MSFSFWIVYLFLITADLQNARGECPRGTEYNDDLCFEAFETATTWEGAKGECESYGGRLAKLSSSDIHNFLSDMIVEIAGGNFKDYWIGALVHKVWNWEGGIQVQYHDWFTNEPNNLQRGEERIMLWYGQYDDGTVEEVIGNYKWIDEDPTTKETHGVISKYICQFDNTICSTISILCNTTGEDMCIDQTGHCFLLSGPLEDKFTSLAYSWSEADIECRNSGGKLAWVEDSSTAQAIIDKINSDDRLIGNYWTGATLDHSATTNNWYWTDDTPVNLINTLDSDFPQSDFCMAIIYTENAETNGYEWLNVDCSSAQSFVCEYDNEIQTQPLMCSNPGTGPHVIKFGTNYSVGAVVTYSCDEGYSSKDTMSATCEKAGNWSNEIPRCLSVESTISLETVTVVVTIIAAIFFVSGFIIGYRFWISGRAGTSKVNSVSDIPNANGLPKSINNNNVLI